LIEGLVELEELFKKLPTGYVYDGELIAVNVDNSASDVLFRYTQKLVRKDGITECSIFCF
jgi:DNA ligase-1